jgi:phage baseplate assembly protein W
MATIKQKRTFTDLDLSFKINPFTGDLYLKRDEEAVKTALKHLVLTSNFERLFHPEIGTQVKSLLFENISPAVRIAIEKNISDVIRNNEPRIRLINVEIIEISNHNIKLNIVFSLANSEEPITVTTTVLRTR